MPEFNELLWIFTQLPDDYVVLEIETTGLPDDGGLPDIVSVGITAVRQREIQQSVEFMTRPQKPILMEAQAIHGVVTRKPPRLNPSVRNARGFSSI